MSSNYITKSVLNLDAAELLTKGHNYHYAPSVHCSYYSCHQLISHIIFIVMAKTESEFSSGLRLRRVVGSHEYAIELVFKDLLKEKNALSEASKFKNEIAQLKRIRTDSDYKNTSIDKLTSDSALSLANSVSNILKSVYQI